MIHTFLKVYHLILYLLRLEQFSQIRKIIEDNKQVRFECGSHKGASIIKIHFQYNGSLAQRVKKLPGARWSQTMRCWYVPDTEAYRARFKLAVPTASQIDKLKLANENSAALSQFVKNYN